MRSILLIFILCCATVQATTYYVKDGGNDGSAGTSWATAWATTAKVVATMSGGDTVYYGTGTFNGRLLPAAGGSSGDRTVYACSSFVEGITTLIYTTVLTGWVQHSGNVYKTACDGADNEIWGDPSCAVVGQTDGTYDTILYMETTLGAVDAAGEFYWNSVTDTIYVWRWGGGDPSSSTIQNGEGPTVEFRSGQDYVTIWGFNIRYGEAGGVYFHNSEFRGHNFNHVEHCDFNFICANGGINVAGVQSSSSGSLDSLNASHGTVVRACTFGYIREWAALYGGAVHSAAVGFYSQWHNMIESCTVIGSNETSHGIFLKSGCPYTTVRYNTLRGTFEGGIGFLGDYHTDSVYGNILYSPTSGGDYSAISFYGGGTDSNVHVYNNTIYGALGYGGVTSGLEDIAPIGLDGPAYVRYNTIMNATVNVNLGIDFAPDDYLDFTIDSNMYYPNSVQWYCNNGTRNWTVWRNTFNFDENASTNNVDPGFDSVAAADPWLGFARSGVLNEMNLTYGGRTWTVFGAVQPSEASEGWGPSSCVDTIIISSLPYTITTADTCYCLSGNLDADSGSGITISANNIGLFIQDDTIWFGDSTSTGIYNDNQFGIKINNVGSIYINGGGAGAIISRGGGGDGVASSDTSWGSRCLQSEWNARYVHVDSLRMSGNGGNAQCWAMGGAYFFKVTNCYLANNSKQYIDRTAYQSAAINMSYFSDTIPGDNGYHLLFQYNTIDSCHHTGGRLKGVVKILDNTIRCSALNNLYPTSGGVAGNSSNTYGFAVQQCSVMVIADSTHVGEIRNNVIEAYDDYFGMDGGLDLEGVSGHPDTPFVIANNNYRVHRGWDPEYSLVACWLKIHSGGGNKYIKIIHDSAWVYARKFMDTISDTTNDSSAYGEWATGAYILSSAQDSANWIDSCYVKAITLLDTTDTGFLHPKHGASGVMLLSDWYEIDGVPTFKITNSTFESNHACVRFGYTDDRAIFWDSVYSNTFNMIDTGAGREYTFFYCMSDGGNSIDNDLNDNNVIPDSVWDIDDWIGASTGNARVRRTLDIYIKGVDKIPVASCTMQVWNDYGDTTLLTDTVASGVTNIYGWFYPPVTLWYSAYDASDSLPASFNPFYVKAFKNGDTITDTISFYPYDDIDTLLLPTSDGGGIAATERFTIGRGNKGGTGTRATFGRKE